MIPMKSQRTTSRPRGQWRFQAQFNKPKDAQGVRPWGHGILRTQYEVLGDSFYTNDLDDIVAVRLQFDHCLRAIHRAE
jgi:hypothetical protein